jgi:autophagy-related protein 13
MGQCIRSIVSAAQNEPSRLLQFNLETPETDSFKDSLRLYKALSITAPPPPRFELQVLLSIPDLTHNDVLVHLAPDGARTRIDPTPKYILLESWFMTYTRTSVVRDQDYNNEVEPHTTYKHGISLFRSLFTLLRVLPSWKLFKRLRRRTGGSNRNGSLSILLRVVPAEGDSDSEPILDFGKSPSSHFLRVSV